MCPVHVVPDTLFNLSHSSRPSSRRDPVTGDNKTGADIESLKKQLQIVDQRLATLTGRLEVLKAVQQVLPAGKLYELIIYSVRQTSLCLCDCLETHCCFIGEKEEDGTDDFH